MKAFRAEVLQTNKALGQKREKYTAGQYAPISESDHLSGGHALAVTKITDDYVEVVNPWDTTKRKRIPRDDFEKMAIGLNVAPVCGKHSDNSYVRLNHNHNNHNNGTNNTLSQIANTLLRLSKK